MKWRGRKQSSNIEDRRNGAGRGSRGSARGSGGLRIPNGRGGGVGGTLVILVVVLVAMFLGVDPIKLISDADLLNEPASNSRPISGPQNDDLAGFVGVVVQENEDMWTQLFADSGLQYAPSIVVLFSGQTRTGCGTASAKTGPFYCPADQKVYIDLAFYEELRAKFGAPGDFAQAYVIAHEIAHHVQQLTGVLPEFNKARPGLSKSEENEWSVRVELQADCYAGVWASYAGAQNLLDRGDIKEALNAANQIGDDTLQKRMQGFAVPKTFNHGTSEQRQRWFQIGYAEKDPAACDTFSRSRL